MEGITVRNTVVGKKLSSGPLGRRHAVEGTSDEARLAVVAQWSFGFIRKIWLGVFPSDVHLQRAARPLDRSPT